MSTFYVFLNSNRLLFMSYLNMSGSMVDSSSRTIAQSESEMDFGVSNGPCILIYLTDIFYKVGILILDWPVCVWDLFYYEPKFQTDCTLAWSFTILVGHINHIANYRLYKSFQKFSYLLGFQTHALKTAQYCNITSF